MFAYGDRRRRRARPSTWSPGRATSTSPPPSALLRGRVGIDSEAGPTEIAILADDTADPAHVAADLISQAEHDPLAAAVLVTDERRSWPTPSRPSSRRQVAATKHVERITAALAGAQSAIVLVDDLDAGSARRRRVRRRAPGDPHPRRARGGGRGCATPGAIFVGTWAPVSLGDYCAGSNHVLPDRRLRLPLRRPVGAVVPARDPRRRLRPRRRCATWPPHVVTLAAAEDLPAHGAAVTVAAARPGRRMSEDPAGIDLPLRDDLRGHAPVRRPAARRAGPAEHQREPVPAVPGAGRRRSAPRCAAARAASTATRTARRVALRADLAAYLGAIGLRAPSRCGRPTARNEVMQQLLQAFGGPGRTALGFAPTYSMYPEYARDTGTRWVAASRGAGRLHARRARARPRRSERTRRTSCSCARRTTRPAPRWPSTWSRRCSTRDRRAWSSSTRRTRSSAAPAPRALSLLPGRPAPGRHPHDEQGVRARRRAARLPGRRPGASSTRCSSSGCRTTCRRSPRRSRVAALGARRRAAGAGRRAARPSATRIVDWLRGRGPRRRRLATPTSCCSAGSPTGTPSGRVCSSAAC